jgi:hypothetical protein
MVEMQTIALDPIVFNDGRAEFLLPDDYYDSASMVLSNLGMFSQDIDIGNSVNLCYPVTCGVAGVISKYTLFSGADEIEMLDHVAQWATIKALNKPAVNLEDIYHNTLHSGWNFGINSIDRYTNVEHPDVLSIFPSNVDYFSNCRGNDLWFSGYQSRIGNTELPPGTSASLKLSMISGFLQATPVLPMIRNLRIVIEYDTNISHYYNQLGGANIPTIIHPTLPMLIVKKFVNPPEMPNHSNRLIPYTVVNCASGFFVSAVDEVGLISRNTYQSYEFMGKFLMRLTVYNAPIDIETPPDIDIDNIFMLNGIKSIAQSNEVINFVINGEKYIPDNGIDSPAIKLQYLLNTHGNFSIPLFCAFYGLRETLNNNNLSSNAIGNLSLTAIQVDAIISTAIQIEYSRQRVVGDTGFIDNNQALNILLFGEIAQLLTINADGSITIES